MKDLKVTSIVPVDLNSLLCMNARTLSQFYGRLGNYTMKKHYEDVANQKNDTMAKIFWDKTDGTWYDYDMNAEGKRRYVWLCEMQVLRPEDHKIYIQSFAFLEISLLSVAW